MTRSARNSRLWQLAGLNAAASLLLLLSFAWNGADTTTEEGCVRQLLDFHVFWNAGGLALEGRPLDAFDYDVLAARYNVCGEAWMPWLHPAPVMGLMMPFALLSFVPAWLAFNAFALVVLGLGLRAFTKGHSPIWLAMLLAPAHLPALLAGQYTVLWMGLLLGAVAAMRAERWLFAGVLIGCLTIKPTLGLLIPVALLAIGAWRTIIAATVTTITLHGVATLAFGGLPYLQNLATNYEALTNSAVSSLSGVSNLTSIAAALAHLGVPEETAVQINLGIAAVLVVILFHVWRRNGAKSDASIALLMASIPLATPYLWHYDSAFLALTALFLLRHLNFAPGPSMTALLTLFWFGAGLSLWLSAASVTEALTPVLTVPPLLLLAFAVSLTHSLSGKK